MQLTNKLDLPQVFFDAVKNDDYNSGDSDITVTQLKSPPRMIALQKKYRDQITEDVSDRAYSLLGQAVHSIIERAAKSTDAMVEERFFMEVNGWKLSGQLDHFHEGVLTDFKVTSAYVVKGHLSGEKDDWHCQLNTLAELLRHNGHDVTKLQVIVILRDWSKLEAARDARFAAENNFEPTYPQHQIQVVDIPMWTDSNWIETRVAIHQEAQVNDMPACTDEDRWKDPDKWAVMKKGKKRALRLLPSQQDAEAWCVTNGHGQMQTIPNSQEVCVIVKAGVFIERRPSEPKRCQQYCNVSHLCEQYQSELRKETS